MENWLCWQETGGRILPRSLCVRIAASSSAGALIDHLFVKWFRHLSFDVLLMSFTRQEDTGSTCLGAHFRGFKNRPAAYPLWTWALTHFRIAPKLRRDAATGNTIRSCGSWHSGRDATLSLLVATMRRRLFSAAKVTASSCRSTNKILV